MLNGKKRLNQGEISISLKDRNENVESYVLRPTSRAWQVISRQYQGLAKARQMILDENADAIVFIVRVGTNMSDRDARNLSDKIWENGIDIDLLVPLIKYIAILNNGGRPLPDDVEGAFDDMQTVEDVRNDRSIEDYTEKND
jgi:hypothetical protein